MNAGRTYGAVLLAAGASTRLGVPKQLIQFRGQTLLERTIAALRPIQGPIVVVTGANHQLICDAFKASAPALVRFEQNLHWQNGMGSSLAHGVCKLRETDSSLDGIIVTVCDQPHLTEAIITDLIVQSSAHPSRIIASDYGSAIGPPACFPNRYFGELCALDGTRGAKDILRKHSDTRITIPFPTGDFDIDTPHDLRQLRSTTTQ